MKQSIPKLNVKVRETSRSESDPTYHDLQFYFDLSDVKKLPGYTPCITTPWIDEYDSWEADPQNYEYGSTYDIYTKHLYHRLMATLTEEYVVELQVPKEGFHLFYTTEQGQRAMGLTLSKLNFRLTTIGLEVASRVGTRVSNVQPFSLDFTFFYKEHPEIQQTITITI